MVIVSIDVTAEAIVVCCTNIVTKQINESQFAYDIRIQWS